MPRPGRVKKKKPKLEKPKKQYELNQCALYGIKGMTQLASVLDWLGSPDSLQAFAAQLDSYRVWTEGKREVQEAKPKLRLLHSRIATLLRRVAPPSYRHSGVRGRSFLSNALEHRAAHASIKLDVRKFYPSTNFSHVNRFFRKEMACAADVAHLLARICCYRQDEETSGHLPTGGVHSEVVAFYAHKRMFDLIHDRAVSRGGNLTVYVDDLMVTMSGACHTDLEWARKLLTKFGLTMHPGKSRVLPKESAKKITGVVIRNGVTTAPPVHHRKAKELEAALTGELDKASRTKAARSLLGQLGHIAQIDERFASRLEGGRVRLKGLLVD